MIDTSHSAFIGGAGIWTPNSTLVGSFSKTLTQLIKSLFSDGSQGIYLNAQDALSVSDLSNVKDLSGNNNHALQANSTSRASLITDPSGYKSLKFDGIDDGYATQSINFTNTDEVTVIAAVRKFSDLIGMIVELSNSISTNNGTFYLARSKPLGTSNQPYAFGSSGTIVSYTTIEGSIAPSSDILSGSGKISTDTNRLKVDNVVVTSSGDQGIGNYGNHPLYIGRRGGSSLPFNGQIYALLVIGKLLDDATTQRIEKEFAKYVGVTL